MILTCRTAQQVSNDNTECGLRDRRVMKEAWDGTFVHC